MPSESVNFDRAADYYDATRGFPNGIAGEVARFIAETANLTNDMRVLEIGVGTGRIALPLSAYTGDYFGADISGRMLGKLRDKQTDEKVHIAQGDVLNLPFPANSVDAVIIVHVLHLVADATQVLREVRRVLKPDGIVLKCQNSFGNASDDPLTPIRDAWMKATESERKARDRWYNVDDLLTDNGFTLVTPKQSFPYQSTTTSGYFLDRIQNRHWSNTWSMPDDICQAGVDAVKQALDDHFDGKLDVPLTQDAGFEVEVYSV